MREVEDKGKTGIQKTLATQLYDLDFADDVGLLSQKLQRMQAKTNNLELFAESTSWPQDKQRENQSHTAAEG